MIVYPPPYECLVWYYKRAKESVITAALNKGKKLLENFCFPIKALINK